MLSILGADLADDPKEVKKILKQSVKFGILDKELAYEIIEKIEELENKNK